MSFLFLTVSQEYPVRHHLLKLSFSCLSDDFTTKGVSYSRDHFFYGLPTGHHSYFILFKHIPRSPFVHRPLFLYNNLLCFSFRPSYLLCHRLLCDNFLCSSGHHVTSHLYDFLIFSSDRSTRDLILLYLCSRTHLFYTYFYITVTISPETVEVLNHYYHSPYTNTPPIKTSVTYFS